MRFPVLKQCFGNHWLQPIFLKLGSLDALFKVPNSIFFFFYILHFVFDNFSNIKSILNNVDNFIAKYYCNTSTEVLPSGSTSNLVSGHWVFTQSFLSLYSDPDLIWISTTEGSLNDIPSFTQEGNRRRKGADFDKGHQCTKWEVEGG